MSSNIKVLIVDDLAENRDVLTTLLGYKGYQLREARNGAAALEMVQAERPDLIITDVLMPTLDGFEMVRQLQAEPETAAIPVIVYSARADHWKARALARTIGVHHISKPTDPEVILRLVNEALASIPPPSPTAAPPAAENSPASPMFDRMIATVNQLETLNYKLAALLDFIEQSLREYDPQRLLEKYCDAACEIIEARGAAVVMFSSDGSSIRHVASSGLDVKTHTRLGTPDVALEHRRRLSDSAHPLHLGDLRDLPAFVDYPPGEPGMSALICLPVGSPGEPIGALYLIGKVGAESFSDADERLAALLASQLAAVYEKLVLSTVIGSSQRASRGETTETPEVTP